MPLPAPIKDEEAGAKWDKKAHVLTLTLPLVTLAAADISDPAPVKAPAPAPPPAPAPAPPPAPAPAPAPPPPPPAAAATKKPAAEVDSPPVEWRQNAQYVAIITQVPGVVKASVDAKFESKLVKIKFESSPPGAPSGAATLKHDLTLHLCGSVETSGCRYDAADNNMMIVLQKATEGEEWASLEDASAKEKAAKVTAAPTYAPEKPVKAGSLASDRGKEEVVVTPPPSAEPPKPKQPPAKPKEAPPPPAQPAAAAGGKMQADKLLFELD